MASIINDESSPNYYVTPTGITISGRTKEYATIADMLADTNPGKYARVADATGDTTVNSGAAIYRREGTDWVKVYEEESMDLENVITWETLSGRPNVTAQAVEGVVASAHNHTNYSVISKLGVNTSGNLTLDGNPVGNNSQDASAAIARLDILEPTVTNLEITVGTHETAITTLQGQNYVFSVNGVTPDADGSIIIPVGNPNSVLYADAMPEPSTDNVGKVVFYSGASTAVFTSGSVYRCVLNNNSGYEWRVITDNSEITALIGLISTNTANISTNQDGILSNTSAITALTERVSTAEDNISIAQGTASLNLNAINALDERIVAVEDKAHTHIVEGLDDAVALAHSHSNLNDLNAITVRNGNLYINGIVDGGSSGSSEGGRVKTFDPGIIVSDASTSSVDLDFNKATCWKLTDTTSTITLNPKNFVDGAEVYVIVYGGVIVSWAAFEFGGNVDESIDANHFDGIVWTEGEAPRAVDSFTYGFQMIKLMVVDNTVVAQLIVDTCTNEASGANATT